MTSEGLSPEEALECLVLHTAMEDAEVANRCEAVLKPILAARSPPPSRSVGGEVEAGELATAARALLAANDRVVTAMVECATEDEALRLAALGGDAFSDTLEPLRLALAHYTAALSAAPAPEGTE